MKNFTRSEFACKCGCGFDTVDYKLVEILDEIREHFDVPVTVNSGCRCEAHNTASGGMPKTATSTGSLHMYGRAADIVVQGIPSAIVADLAIQMKVPGVGEYPTFVHLDTRSGGKWRG